MNSHISLLFYCFMDENHGLKFETFDKAIEGISEAQAAILVSL